MRVARFIVPLCLCLTMTSTTSYALGAQPPVPASHAQSEVTEQQAETLTVSDAILAPADPRYDPRLGASRNRIRLNLDQADALTRAEFWIGSMYFGAWTAAFICSGIADLRSSISLPLTLVGVSGGIVGAYAFRQHFKEMNGGTLAAINLGLFAGLLDGVMLGSLGASSLSSVKTRNRIALGTGWALSGAGAVGAGLLAHRLGASTGDIGLLATTTFWGAATGLLADFTARGKTSGSWQVPLSALMGSVIGTATGLGLVSQFDISRTRSFFIDLGGVSGMLLSLAVVEGSPRLRRDTTGGWATLLGGELIGLAAGTLATLHLDTPLAKTSVKARLTPSAIPIESAQSAQMKMVPGVLMAGSF